MAVVVIATVPILPVYLSLQQYVAPAILAGTIKGGAPTCRGWRSRLRGNSASDDAWSG